MDVDVKALGFNPSGDSMSRCSPRRGIGCPESADAGCSLQHQGKNGEPSRYFLWGMVGLWFRNMSDLLGFVRNYVHREEWM